MKYTSTIVVVVIVALFGGIFGFAEASLPGDSLYKVKISVNEPVAGLFAFTKEEKAEWEERLVERRLKEVEKIVSANNFSETERINMEKNIKNQIEKFTLNLNNLELNKEGKTNSADLNLRLQAALSAYQSILKKVAQKTNIDENTKKEVTILLATLKAFEVGATNSQTNPDFMKNSQTNSTIETASPLSTLASVQEEQNTAEDALNATKLLYQKDKLRLRVNIQNEIDGKLADAENAIKDAKALIDKADYANASTKFQSAVELINEAKLAILSNLIRENINPGREFDDEEEFDD